MKIHRLTENDGDRKKWHWATNNESWYAYVAFPLKLRIVPTLIRSVAFIRLGGEGVVWLSIRSLDPSQPNLLWSRVAINVRIPGSRVAQQDSPTMEQLFDNSPELIWAKWGNPEAEYE